MATYDPKDFVILFGPLNIQGFADGDMCTIAYNSGGASVSVGARGDAVIVKNWDQSANVTVRLFQSLDGARNEIAALDAHILAGNLALPLAVSLNGENYTATEAVVQKYADATFSADSAPVREYTFVVGRLIKTQAPAVGGIASGLSALT